ncbi:MAG TPA: nitrophenyl compound nitroreductase subunit ArsF family protein [Planctomycetota bacterium]|nr:nitrophenyl compound nitroreductase subunit ArsF family protein [Planctomycetota bacterium]
MMDSKTQRFLGAALITFAVASLAYGIVRERGREGESAIPAAEAFDAAVTVYYFHTDVRCKTCNAIEAKTRSVLERTFASELALGRLRFVAINMDAPDGRVYRDRFDLSFGTVVVIGRGQPSAFQNLEEVWGLIGGEELEFDEYITSHVRTALEANP